MKVEGREGSAAIVAKIYYETQMKCLRDIR